MLGMGGETFPRFHLYLLFSRIRFVFILLSRQHPLYLFRGRHKILCQKSVGVAGITGSISEYIRKRQCLPNIFGNIPVTGLYLSCCHVSTPYTSSEEGINTVPKIRGYRGDNPLYSVALPNISGNFCVYQIYLEI
jgi:hypothetical protein